MYSWGNTRKFLNFNWLILTLTQSNLFPERETVFDYYFQKKGGTWCLWEDLLERNAIIPADAKVNTVGC